MFLASRFLRLNLVEIFVYMLLVVDIGETVEHHAVSRLQVAQLHAMPTIEVMRHLRHAFHSSGDGDIDVPL